jgi:hypothetical protein
MNEDYRHFPLIKIAEIFDPESVDWECREYNFLVSVQVQGHIRQRYFLELHDATEWACDKVLELIAKLESQS